jgi:hypothetical protein
MSQVIEELQALSEERFLAMYESMSNQGFGPLDGDVAKALKFRPQAIRKLPMPRRAKQARAILLAKSNAELAYEFFGSYLLRNHKELVTGFLDATGVPHEDGMIARLEAAIPAADRLAATIADLDRKFPPEDVTLYLAMCAQQWPQVSALDATWRARR